MASSQSDADSIMATTTTTTTTTTMTTGTEPTVSTITTATATTAPSSALADLRGMLPCGEPGRLVNSFIFAGHAGALEFQKQFRVEMQRLYCLPEPTYRLIDHFDEDLGLDRVNPPETERRLSGLFPLLGTGYRISYIADISQAIVRGSAAVVTCERCGDPFQLGVEWEQRPGLLSPSSWKNVAGWDPWDDPILYVIEIDVLSKADCARVKKYTGESFDDAGICGSCYRADNHDFLRSAIECGSRVAVEGLKAKPQFNGKLGTCVPATDEEANKHGSFRYKVELDEGGKPVLLKPENIRALEPWRQAEKDDVVVSAGWTSDDDWVRAEYLEDRHSSVFDGAMKRWCELDSRFRNVKREPWRKITNDADIRELEDVVRLLHDAAHQGHAKAQCHLGFMYADGHGVDQSDALAVEWCRKAADQGFALAQSNLGRMYHRGLHGVGQSTSTAVEWYRKAADRGYEGAQTNLGFMYSKGIGVDQSDATALKWFRRAAAKGDAQAQTNLSVMYSTGEGVPKDEGKALRWLLKAADQGSADASFKLGFKYHEGKWGLDQNYTLAMKWYRNAADQGHPSALCNVGAMYAAGCGVDRDLDEALRWFRKAEAQGESDLAPRSIQWVLRRSQLEQEEAAAAPPQPPAPAQAQARDTSLPAPPNPPPPISIDDFRVDDDVEIRGLQSRPELNGERGVVVAVDVASERCLVRLHNGSGPFRLKPASLYFV